jgi:glycogen synthase
MKLALFTNEFPPHIYGGAGVHVDFLTRELKKSIQVHVQCFGEQDIQEANLNVKGHLPSGTYQNAPSIFQTLERDLQFAASNEKADIIHCHTWYSHLAGILSQKLLQIPLILTTHSLEPHRPWKVEQLGNAYHLSSWIEKSAYEAADGIIAVSEGMKKDVIAEYNVDPDKVQVIYNGIDLDFYQETYDEAFLKSLGIDPEIPYVLFVGRITRQKGITELLQVIPKLQPDTQVVLCAGAPDTPEIAQEMKSLFKEASANRKGVFWIEEMLPVDKIKILYSHARVFACPSVYEPFGIINLEAMACNTPVVGSSVGGIPEIIINEETGFLIDLDFADAKTFALKDPNKMHQDFADKLNLLLSNADLAEKMGKKSRERVESIFSWENIAMQTLAFYQKVLEKHNEIS